MTCDGAYLGTSKMRHHGRWLIPLAIFLQFASLNGKIIDMKANSCNTGSKQIFIPGDLILGGMFAIHESGQLQVEDNKCTARASRIGCQELLAMLIAVNKVNENEAILPALKLGVHIKDTHGNVDIAVREVLNFSFVQKHYRNASLCSLQKKRLIASPSNSRDFGNETVAIIGPDLSDTARAVADLAGLFHVPVVSPSATSHVLSDRKRFGHFFRTVPPDNYQAKAIIDLITHFRWNFIILLTSDDEYGRSGRSALREEIKKRNLCAEIDEVVTVHNSHEVIKNIAKNETKAKVIVSFLTIDHLVRVFRRCHTVNLTAYTWIASDSWINRHFANCHQALVLQGMLVVGPMPTYLPEFQEELSKATKNPSFYSTNNFNCFEYCQTRQLLQCVGDDKQEVSPFVGPTFDAVYAVAHALHNMIQATRWQRLSDTLANRNLIDYMQNVTFEGISGRSISFDGDGTTSSAYQILNSQKSENGFKLVPVANWIFRRSNENVSKTLDWISDVVWNSGGKQIPTSSCSRNCQPGEYKIIEKYHPSCCWVCAKCKGETVASQINAEQCLKCPGGFFAGANKTRCHSVDVKFMAWNEPISKTLVVLSTTGLAMAVITFITFYKFRSTPVVKAASQSHCYLLLFGCVTFDLLPFVFIGKPTKFICDLRFFLLGFCLSLNVGTILVKTNQIAKTFSKKPIRPKANEYKWQIFVILCIVVIEELICLVWILALDEPLLATVSMSRSKSCLTCSYGESSKGVALWFCYNAGLILVCTYQALMVRKAPNNYKESKFMLFTMLALCIVILIYVSVTFGGTGGCIKDIIFCFFSIFMGTLEFLCIFAPKLYIMAFRPRKNVEM